MKSPAHKTNEPSGGHRSLATLAKTLNFDARNHTSGDYCLKTANHNAAGTKERDSNFARLEVFTASVFSRDDGSQSLTLNFQDNFGHKSFDCDLKYLSHKLVAGAESRIYGVCGREKLGEGLFGDAMVTARSLDGADSSRIYPVFQCRIAQPDPTACFAHCEKVGSTHMLVDLCRMHLGAICILTWCWCVSSRFRVV